jgi:hypothetical protein
LPPKVGCSKGRGIYRVADAPLESHEDLALLALRKPDAVV